MHGRANLSKMVKTREDVIEEVIENVKFDIDGLEGMLKFVSVCLKK